MRFVILSLLLGLVDAFGAESKITLENIRYRQYVDGPVIGGRIDYPAGSVVFLDFLIANFTVVEKELIRSMDVAWSWQLLDPANREVVPAQSGEVSNVLEREDKDWKPKVRAEISLPASLPSGAYKLRVRVQDRKADTDVSHDIFFRVSGRTIPEATALAINDLRFYRGEDDADPLATPAYRPGDLIWIRFDVLGFQLSEKNATRIDFDLIVENAKGDVVINAPLAFTLNSEPAFYPPRFLSTALRIELDKSNPTGPYLLKIRAIDQLAKAAEATIQMPFTLE